MVFHSVNKWMSEAAAKIPDSENAAVFMRHSERYTDPVDGNYDNLLLTPNGIKMANETGASLDRQIRFLRCSPIERCRQTICETIRTVQKEYTKNIHYDSDGNPLIKEITEFKELLGDPSPIECGGVGWFEYFHYLQEHDINATRGISLESEAKRILDTFFEETLDLKENISTVQNSKTLDLVCSHDGHVVILASALFNLKTETVWTEQWCSYAEGIFFYGNRKDFTAMWRNQTKRFKNFLL